MAAGEFRGLRRGEFHLNAAGNGSGDIALESKNVREVAFKIIGPQGAFNMGLKELRGNAHALARADNGTLHDGIHVQFLGNVLKSLLGVLVRHNRRPGDDAEFLDLRELGDQGVRHAIGKIILRGIAGEISEGQNRDGLDRARHNVFGLIAIASAQPIAQPHGDGGNRTEYKKVAPG